jgi:pimeloyl-ACP methyl ester carboxylesterase
MGRRHFRAATAHGSLAGWTDGRGEPLLVLHGGPGLEASYLDGQAAELASEFSVALFQQRGLPPSTEEGPFTLAQAIDDACSVMDHLGWERAHVLGHSWGGHLAFHLAVQRHERLHSVLAVDPLGGVGDGGMAVFGARIRERLAPADRCRFDELAALEGERGLGRDEQAEQLAIAWPAYFANPAAAPRPQRLAQCAPAGEELHAEVVEHLPRLERDLSTVTVPVGVVVGELSPMPPALAGLATAERIRGAWSWTVPQAGHFPWFERPGCVLEAARRLVRGRADSGDGT